MEQQIVNEDRVGARARRQRDSARGRARSRGQVLVIFALSIFVFIGMCAVVVDVAWYWANTLRVQRAADAAALAGAVLLPGKVNTGADNAYLRARNEATKNGYTAIGPCPGPSCVTVTPVQDSQDTTAHPGGGGNPRRLNVYITAAVPTFFMRVFGITSIDATRAAKAEYVLPVPMGSPQNYYGVGLFIGAGKNTGLKAGTPSGSGWSNPGRADGTDNNSRASSGIVSGTSQNWGTFGLQGTFVASDPIDGIEVRVQGRYGGSGGTSNTNCQLQVQLSWNGGTSWAPPSATSETTWALPSSDGTVTFGDATSTDDWSGHTWTRADLADGQFMVRLTFNKPACAANRTAEVDTLQVRVTSQAGPRPVYAPDGTLLAPQNFWGALQSQGAPNIQGDAFMTKYQDRGPISLNGLDAAQDPDAYFDPANYYNYGVEIPANATNGSVYVFDPGFCEVSTSQGTGESWTVGGANGNSTAEPVTTYYDLYDTKSTPYDLTDDGLPVASSGSAFQNLDLDDASLGGSNGSGSCQGLAWHSGWWLLASGLSGGTEGTVYRLHTHSNAANQDNTTALNAFAIWATATGGTPRVYGAGAMEGYVRLPGGQASQFYLAQIDAVHAGKTMQIDLWDPGDTGALSASLQILEPTGGVYAPAAFTYKATRGSTDDNASNCAAQVRTVASTAPVTTNTGSNSLFNGCWLRLTIVLDDGYAAPTPTGETEGGWWKIKYTMGGSTSSYSTDLTTWKVQIIGNPVHLVVP